MIKQKSRLSRDFLNLLARADGAVSDDEPERQVRGAAELLRENPRLKIYEEVLKHYQFEYIPK